MALTDWTAQRGSDGIGATTTSYEGTRSMGFGQAGQSDDNVYTLDASEADQPSQGQVIAAVRQPSKSDSAESKGAFVDYQDPQNWVHIGIDHTDELRMVLCENGSYTEAGNSFGSSYGSDTGAGAWHLLRIKWWRNSGNLNGRVDYSTDGGSTWTGGGPDMSMTSPWDSGAVGIGSPYNGLVAIGNAYDAQRAFEMDEVSIYYDG